MNIGMMFKWAKLPEDDPIGLVVSLDSNGELVLGSSNIIGVVGATPEILLNNPEEWGGKYVVDEFYRREKYTHKGKDGYVTSNNYNPNKSYQKREDRENWATVITHGIVIAKSVKPINGYTVGVDKAGYVINGGNTLQVVKIIRQPSIKKGFMSSKIEEHGLVKVMVK
tara:strand:- start:195 stop:698 length:504 start_codon:yes stop_codon:yes gene_type:complete